MPISSLNRIGLLGGAFDPIHHGHLRIAQEALEQLQLDQVRFIPTAKPPHKAATQADFAARCAMVELAISGNSAFTLDPREGNCDKPSYSVVTLRELQQKLPSTECHWLLGSDAWDNITTWHEWQECLELATFVVMNRPSSGNTNNKTVAKLPPSAPKSAKIKSLPINPLDISSSQIRALLQQDRSPQYLLPASVMAYLQQHQLYANNTSR